MDVTTIEMSKAEAEQKIREFRAMTDTMTDEDKAMLAGYLAIAEGKPVVSVAGCLRDGGEHEDRTPRLAIARADWEFVWLRRTTDGNVTFQPAAWPRGNATAYEYTHLLSEGGPWISQVRALVPPIPPAHRPRRSGLRKHLILFEVDQWEKVPNPPGDPALLRPIYGDLATVEHTWDLTPLEQAVLAGRRGE